MQSSTFSNHDGGLTTSRVGEDAQAREPPAADSADDRDREVLCQQLSNDPPAARAEWDPHRNLPRPWADRARKQEVREVGACDQQHESHRAQQRPAYRGLRSDPRRTGGNWRTSEGSPGSSRDMGGRQPPSDHFHLRAGALDRDAFRQRPPVREPVDPQRLGVSRSRASASTAATDPGSAGTKKPSGMTPTTPSSGRR